MQPILPGIEKGSTHEELTKQMMFAALVAPEAVKNFGILHTFVTTICSWLCTPLEFFLRVEHGERAISPLRVFNSFLALRIFWFVSSGIGYLLGAYVRTSPLSGMVEIERSSIDLPPFFQSAFLLASAFHLWRVSYRRRKGLRIHSYSAGYSIIELVGLLDLVNLLLRRWKIPFRCTRWHLYLYFEPLIGALVARFLQAHDPITSAWLYIASGSLFIRNWLMAAQQRHILLDYWDSQLDAEHLFQAANQAPPTETAGIMVLPGFAEAFAHAEELDIAGRVSKTFSSVE